VGDNMSDNNQEQENIDSVVDDQIEVDKSKRKFSKAGIAAPVVMILANRPAWGNANTKCAVSGFDSLDVKNNAVSGVTYDSTETCGAVFDWETDANKCSWPNGYRAIKVNSTNINKYDGCKKNIDGTFVWQDKQLLPVFNLDGDKYFINDIFPIYSSNTTIFEELQNGIDIFLQDMISLYLSSVNGTYGFLTTDEIVDAYTSSGNISVGGVSWSSSDFDGYLTYLKNHS